MGQRKYTQRNRNTASAPIPRTSNPGISFFKIDDWKRLVSSGKVLPQAKFSSDKLNEAPGYADRKGWKAAYVEGANGKTSGYFYSERLSTHGAVYASHDIGLVGTHNPGHLPVRKHNSFYPESTEGAEGYSTVEREDMFDAPRLIEPLVDSFRAGLEVMHGVERNEANELDTPFDAPSKETIELESNPTRGSRQIARTRATTRVRGFDAGLRRMRNPEGEDGNGESMYETFHGRPSEQTLEYRTEEFEHSNYGALGDLIELKVITPSGAMAVLTAPNPDSGDLQKVIKLCSNPEGTQLYFIGGDQSIDLHALKFTDEEIKDNTLVGVLDELTYRTEKDFHKFKLTEYFHKLGEDTGQEPILLYDPNSQLMKVAGGAYRIEKPGIIN